MRIIAFKDNLYNTQDFMKKVASQPFLEGISFNVTTTKDGTIVIFSPISTNESLLDNIQKVTFEEFKNRMFTTLEETLKIATTYKGRILINIMPLLTSEITDDNIEYINKITYQYVERIIEIINRYPNLNIYIASSSHRIIYYLVQLRKKFKIGVTLESDNLNYIDVDFYTFNPYMFDFAIMNQQLKQKKEIMVSISTLDELSLIIGYFSNETPIDIKKNVFNSLIAITPHTEILYRLQQSEANNRNRW